MSAFDSYDQEFSSLSQEIDRNVSELKSNDSDSPQNAALIRQAEGLFSQCQDIIKQMEVEARSQDPATKKVLIEKVNLLKKSNTKSKADFQSVKEKAERSSLIGEASGSDRQRFLETNEK
jgi:hypothetical protein